MTKKEKYLVTTALPYANGPIHLGHVLEAIQTDIWVRFQKASGNECYFFCADDTHGTPVMLAAKKENITPEELIARIQKEHYRDLTAFHISYDNYYTTNSEENRQFSEEIYLQLKQKGHISEKEIEQSFCEHDNMFLPDRFIKGTCPKCGAQDQYGDNCESCGASYSPRDLKQSHCAICGNTPVLKKSRHFFFMLQDFSESLQTFIRNPQVLQEGVSKKLEEWFQTGLQEWDISRDGPYFGFKIPGEENKYFYVWLDAPVGYMASSKNFFGESSVFDSFWKTGEGKIVHFIGKDILYFHTLFWPAMLEGAGLQKPSRVNVHGFLTVNGEKMSKSRGTFIRASIFVRHQDPEHFRFYLASKLSSGLDDIDLNFQDYISKINSDLIGNLVNIVSRIATSILDKLDRKIGVLSGEGKLILNELLDAKGEIMENYDSRNYSKVIRKITALGDIVNKYVNDNAPWVLIKDDKEKAREIVTTSLNCARVLAIYLGPVVPDISEKILKMLGVCGAGFAEAGDVQENISVEPYQMISRRTEEKAIQEMIEQSKETSITVGKQEKKESEGLVSIEDLTKVQLVIGEIVEASAVEGADKLLNIKVNTGNAVKNVFAGIKSAYKPGELQGLKVVVVNNLQPRKMKFGISEAMLLATGSGDTLYLVVPHRDAQAGDILK